MIIGTTSMKSILQEMEVVDCFNVCQHVPSVIKKEEVTAVLSQFNAKTEEVRKISDELEATDTGGVPIKTLILSIELALQSSPSSSLETKYFMEAFKSVNHGY